MTKIFVKINQPKTQVLSDEDDEARISTAMRLVDLNIGNFAPNSRGLINVNPIKLLLKTNLFVLLFRKPQTQTNHYPVDKLI